MSIILNGQTFDCAVYYFITSVVYTRALMLGEKIRSESSEDRMGV